MTGTQYLINHRPLSIYSPLNQELFFESHKNYLFDLSYLGVMNVEGKHGSEFLQGQISCDVREINTKQMRQGALCNLKGRVTALLDVLEWQGLHLILPDDLVIETQRSLMKAAMLSRVNVQRSSAHQLFGLYLQNKDDLLPFNIELPLERWGVSSHETYCCYHLGDNFFIVLVSSKQTATFISSFHAQNQWRGSLAWHALQLQHRRIEIYPESRGLFLPHRLGLHLSGYLNFNKGCYKGQEIIARTHFRATLKHELKLFVIETSEPLCSGQKMYANHRDIEIGELIDFCPIKDEKFIIAASVLFDHPSQCLIEGHQHPVCLS
ncbi:YgfZ/GcvT domain-containing protein [Legionella oakridgensis]|uniref:CAF17-like 4Fe-4S cluster assembly/insertion protein YgfZ n=1 Tax=Legionella oakridgensis TaxID=29423 RepID=UPI0003DE2270|nr:folate-binding protein YgfZ [Legionella oakridgensis]ETO93259.1 folate-binding protein YgfZ [Legionella oakridgensis RV-2-2007]